MTTGKFSGLDTTTWRGLRTCKCAVCHEVFSSERAFVLHRIPGQVNGPPATYRLSECRDPRTKGMTLNKRGIWSRPVDPESSLAKLREKHA